MYRVLNKTNSMITLDDMTTIHPRQEITVLTLTPEADVLRQRHIIDITDLGGTVGFSYQLTNVHTSPIIYENGVIPLNSTAYVKELTPGLSDALSRGWITASPIGGGGGGGGGPETDPTVTVNLTNTFGAATGFTGKGSSAQVVTVPSLGTVFDINATEPAKLSVVSLTGAAALTAGNRGLVPAPAAGDQTKFLRGDATWANVSSGASLYSAATAYVVGDLVRDGFGAVWLITSAHTAASGSVDASQAQPVNESTGIATVAQGTAAYTFASGDAGVVADATTTAQTITLPSANSKKLLFVKRSSSNTSVVTVSRSGADTIDGSPTFLLPSAGDAVILSSNGSTVWSVLSKPASAASAMTAATNALAGTSGSTPVNIAGTQRAFLRGDATWAYAAPLYSVGVDYKVGETFVDSAGDFYVVHTAFTSAATIDSTRVYEYRSSRRVVSAAAAYSVTSVNQLLLLTGASAQTITLPAIAATDDGLQIVIKVAHTQVGGATINRTGADTIDGSASFGLNPGEALTLEVQGTVWRVITRPATAGSVMAASSNSTPGASGSTPTNAAGTQRAFLRGDATWAYSAPAFAAATDYKIGEEFVDSTGHLWVVTANHLSAATPSTANAIRIARHPIYLTSAGAVSPTAVSTQVECTGNNQTITMPALSGVTLGTRYTVRAATTSTGTITIARSAADLFEGLTSSTSLTMVPGETYVLEASGAGTPSWIVVSRFSSVGTPTMVASTNALAGTAGVTPLNAAGTQRAFLRGDATWAYTAPDYAVGVDYKGGEIFKTGGQLYVVITNHTSAATPSAANTIKFNPVDAVTSLTTTATVTNANQLVLANGGAGFTITLPTQLATDAGLRIALKARTGQVGTVSIAAGGANTIDGSSTVTMVAGEFYILQADGTGLWHVLSKVGSSSSVPPVITTSASYTITSSDRSVVGNVAIGAGWNLPSLAVFPDGALLNLKRATTSSATITVSRNGADTIDGATSYVLNATTHFLILLADRVSGVWRIVSQASSGGLTLRNFQSTHSAVSGAPTGVIGMPSGWSAVTSGNDLQVTHNETAALPSLYLITSNIAAQNTIISPGTAFRIRQVSAVRFDLISATNGNLGGTNGSTLDWKFYY